MQRALDIRQLASAAGELLGVAVDFSLRSVAGPVTDPYGPRLHFQDSLGGSAFLLEFSPELAITALARVLGRPPPLASSQALLDPSLAGAISAVVVELARRTHAPRALRAVPSGKIPEAFTPFEATVSIEGRPYAARAWVPTDSGEHEPEPSLETLGSLPIGIPLVAAVSLAVREDLQELCVGDAWLPSSGWLIGNSGHGPALLAGPHSDQAIAVLLGERGEVVLRGEAIPLAIDEGETMTQPKDAVPRTITETALEAPVVVRVELGTVILQAREWAALCPGDVIETGRRVAEPVVLRVAGQEVARGELVNIDGELGVRISELCTNTR